MVHIVPPGSGAHAFYDRPMLPEGPFTRLVEEQAASDLPGAATARNFGLLTVFGTLGMFYLLSRSGEVFVDCDDGVVRPASDCEREFAYVQAARRYPLLGHLMPERPPSARTCDLCLGAGEVAVNDGRNLLCCPRCNTRGWTAAL